MRVPLEVSRWKNPYVRGPVAMWRESEPFVHNKSGILVHRPRFVSVYNTIKGAHIAIQYYCGNSVTDNEKRSKTSFLAAPSEDCIVCHVCEQRAVMAGLATSSEIAGRHVHTGRLRAVTLCCPERDK